MIKSRHTELRAVMVRHGYHGYDLADKLGISAVTMSAKLCGKVPFTQTEMYIIMDLFALPYSLLPIMFPKNGIQDRRCFKELPTDLPQREEYIRLLKAM
jgi:transcriptional regulator with XRE-family HTH domain